MRKAEEFVSRLGIKVRGDGTNEISIAFPNRSRIVLHSAQFAAGREEFFSCGAGGDLSNG
jgi:hypothetical protein